MESKDEQIGRAITEARNEAGLDQKQLSELLLELGLNWSQGTVSRVETGDRPVRLSEVAILQEALGVDANSLLSKNDIFQTALERADKQLKASNSKLRDARAAQEMAQFSADKVRLINYLATGRSFTATVYGCTSFEFFHFEAAELLPSLPTQEAAPAVWSEVLRRDGHSQDLAAINAGTYENIVPPMTYNPWKAEHDGNSLVYSQITESEQPQFAELSANNQTTRLQAFKSMSICDFARRLYAGPNLTFRNESNSRKIVFDDAS